MENFNCSACGTNFPTQEKLSQHAQQMHANAPKR